jgi:hypothetical protein
MFHQTRHIVPAFVMLAGGLIYTGCSSGGNKESMSRATVEALPSLPQADIAKLQPVPDQQQLATSEIKRAVPQPSPEEDVAHPNCAADEIEFDYTAKVSYPVTVCTSLDVVVGVFSGGPITPTHKLEASALSPEQLAAFGSTTPKETIFWCHQSKGPWQATLNSDHACSGTCDTQNVLTLTNTPNIITFHWTGAINPPPSIFNFQYVGQPKLVDKADLGKCHPQNEKPGADRKGN